MSVSNPPVNQGVAAADRELPVSSLLLLTLCFVLSGLAALVYQTAWTRQFALVFGTSELAVATVLAAYMAGLALGAALVERWLPRVRRPVLTYAILELGIAISAVLLVPLCIWLSNTLLQAFFGGQPAPPSSDQVGTSLFYLLGAFAALVLPTTLMGATLPLLARHAVQDERQIGRRIGLLYAANTAGAVGGALLTAFILLPLLGLNLTVWTAAALNTLVFLLAVFLARGSSPMAADAATLERVRFRFRTAPDGTWVLPLMLLAGAVAFFHEVLWSRMLSHVLGSSIYAFGVMVASFLTGIALGGALGAGLARTRERAAMALGIALILAAIAAAGAFLMLERLIPTSTGLLQNVTSVLGVQIPLNTLFAGGLLLPMTICIGATYPLAVRILATTANDAAPASARVYAWNTVGAILGSLAAGFWLIPALRYEGAIRLAVIVGALLGVLALWLLVRPLRVIAGLGTVAAALVVVLFQPRSPTKLLVTSPLQIDSSGKVLFYDVGRSASVIVLEQDGGLAMRTNGLPEALMEMPGSLPRFSGEFWLSPITSFARPDAQSMLIVGYGGGVVVEGVPPSFRSIDVIELEPKVIAANRATRELRKRDPLTDPRLTIISNDARGSMSLTNKRYDAIVSQPSHPWTAGASHLYTREFMQLAREHLNEDGIFVQWMNVAFLDERLLRSLSATLLDVFGQLRVYRPDPATLVFVASSEALDIERGVAATGLPLRRTPLHFARVGINSVEDLVTALVLDQTGAQELAAGAPLITDNNNRMATSSVYELGRGMSPDATGRILAPYDPLQRPDSFVYRELSNALAFDYIARRMATFMPLDASLADRIKRMGNILGSTAQGDYVRALAISVAGRNEAGMQAIREAAFLRDDSELLRYELVRQNLGKIAAGRPSADFLIDASKLTGTAAAVVRGTQLAAANDWAALAAMDQTLAQARWTDPWYVEATQLRADWRSRVTTPGRKRQLGDEALALVDRLAVVTPGLGLYALRARSALAAERPDVLIESVWVYGRTVIALASTRPLAERGDARRDVENVLELLRLVERQPGANQARIEQVRTQLGVGLTRLGV